MQIQLIADRSYQAAIQSVLAQAQRSIDLVQLEFFSDSGFCKTVADRLIELKYDHPKMRIHVVLEGFRRRISERNAETKERLAQAGIQVRLGTPNRVIHAKAVLVDGRILLSGSHNLSNNSVARNHETSLLIESTELGRGLKKYLNALFKDPSRDHSFSAREASTTLLLDSACYEELIRLIRQSRSTFDMAMYYIAYSDETDRVAQTLLKELAAAHERGVRIRLLLEQGSPYLPYITAGNKRAAAYLLKQGLSEIYFDPYNVVLHAKYVIRDGVEALLGSTNWYDKDFFVHHQINFKTKDKKTVRSLSQLFEQKLSFQTTRFGSIRGMRAA